MMRRAPAALVALMVLASAACSASEPSTVAATTPPFAASQRAVRIETTGCGHASDRVGSGVAVGDGLVVTVAHLVVEADDITASVAGGEPDAAVVIAVDRRLDLALLRMPANSIPAVATSTAEQGATGLIVGAAASGNVRFEVTEVVTLTIEEVLGSDRYSRAGYQLEALTATGDSGAGAYDDEDGLLGIVFATGQDGASSWVTSSVEVEKFLTDHAAHTTPITCDEEQSRLAGI